MSMKRLLGATTALLVFGLGISFVVSSEPQVRLGGFPEQVAGKQVQAQGPNVASQNGNGRKIGHQNRAETTVTTTTAVIVTTTAVPPTTQPVTTITATSTTSVTPTTVPPTTSSPPTTVPPTAPSTSTTTSVPGAVVVAPGTNLQSLVDANPAGTTFLLKAGVHRNIKVVPREGNKFVGEAGTILDGGGVTQHAFSGDAKNVTIQGLVIERYATPAQQGVISGWGSGWIVIDNEIRYNAGAGVGLNGWFRIEGNFIHHNEQIGILARGSNGVVVSNEIAFNNPNDRYDMGWEAGGTKFMQTTNLYVAKNYVHDNHGIGLWTDHNNYQTVYEGNTVANNYGPGILHEISYDAVIRNNTVTGNAHRFYVGGILVATSSNVEVTGNQLANNDGGVIGLQDSRGSGTRGTFQTTGLWAHNNSVAYSTGWNGLSINGGPDVSGSGINRYDYNQYQLSADPTPFNWGYSEVNIDQWKALGLDVNGSFS